MVVWRISNYLDLSGQGGLRAPARWHNAGAPIVYTASSPASALVEMLVHLELGDVDCLPDSYMLLMIEISDRIPVTVLDESMLTPGWHTLVEETRTLGDAWLMECDTAILSVPGAIVPHTKNYLINPLHRDAKKIKIRSYGRYPFDSRLFK